MRLEVKGTHKFLKKNEFSSCRAVIHMSFLDMAFQKTQIFFHAGIGLNLFFHFIDAMNY